MHLILGYLDMCVKLWLFKVKLVCVVFCKIWIALVYVAQHVGGCAQVFATIRCKYVKYYKILVNLWGKQQNTLKGNQITSSYMFGMKPRVQVIKFESFQSDT